MVDSDGMVLNKYERLKILGRGSYGKATLVKHAQSGGMFVLKEIDVSQMSEKEKQLNNNEATVLAMLSHENIVQVRAVNPVAHAVAVLARTCVRACSCACHVSRTKT